LDDAGDNLVLWLDGEAAHTEDGSLAPCPGDLGRRGTEVLFAVAAFDGPVKRACGPAGDVELGGTAVELTEPVSS
jgi:hypothetical protein